MNKGEIRDFVRQMIFDRAGTQDNEFRWPDPILDGFINEAQTEACWRKSLLVEESIPALGAAAEIVGGTASKVALTAGTAVYPLDAKALFVRKVRLAGQSVPLAATDYREMDKSYHGWDAASGAVERYITGLDAPGHLKLRLYRIPSVNGTAYLTLVREPVALVEDGDVPEIARRYHLLLADWVLWRCFSDPDPDKSRPEWAAEHKARFIESFGTREDNAALEATMQQATANPMAYLDGTW